MKLSRKLIPAFIMLLVSAVLMSTASFAWFSTNNSAEINGMKVKIATATTLLVKDADTPNAVYATSWSYNSLQKNNMSPLSAATPADVESNATGITTLPTFYKLDAANGIAPGASAFTDDSTFVEDEAGEHYLTETLMVRATGDGTLGAMTLAVGVNEGAATAINKSLRVMFAVYDPDAKTVKWFRCSPYGGTEIQPIASIQEDGTVTTEDLGTEEAFTTGLVSEDGAEIIASVAAETEYVVTFYVWFEGQDATCFANNAVALQEVELTFTFALPG